MKMPRVDPRRLLFSGRFELHSELWNGMPCWRRTARYDMGDAMVPVWLYNTALRDERGHWAVGLSWDRNHEVSEGSHSDFMSVAPHAGAMPEEVEWQCYEEDDEGDL